MKTTMDIHDYNKVTDRLEPSEKCRNEVLNMNKRRKKNIRLNKRGIAAATAVVIAACGGTAAFAAEKLGAFSKLNDILSGTYVDERGNELKKDKFDEFDYSQISTAAQVFEKPIPLDGDDIKLTVESVYCDGCTLVVGVTGSLNNGNPEGFEFIPFSTALKLNGNVISRARGDNIISEYSKLYLENGETNSFSGTFRYIFGNSLKIREATDIEMSFYDFKPNSNTYGTPDGIMGCDTPSLSDRFTFELNVSPDEESIRHIEHSFTDDEGYTVNIMDISAAVMEIECWATPEDREAHADPYKKEHPDSKVGFSITDGNGKKLDYIGVSGDYKKDDGRHASLFQPPTSDIITLTYYDSNIPDENGEPTFVHEMTIDLGTLTVVGSK